VPPNAREMLERLRALRVARVEHRHPSRVNPMRWEWRPAAAAIVLGVTVMMIGWSAGVWHISRRVARSSVVYTTGNGERANIALPDGDTILLNVASRIEVPQDFGIRNRMVSLQGQADFRVAHQRGAPFTVEAGGTRTAVLGTEFEVRAYRGEPVQLAVRTGRVMIRSVVLSAGDIATVAPNRVMVSHNQDLDTVLGFTHGQLVLNNVPLLEALPDLERWYNVKIQLRDPDVGAIPVHAVLTNGSIGDLMEALRVTLGLHVVWEGRTLTLDRR
jgi:transmembrane sensor